MGLASWCCEVVNGVECELVIDDAYDAGPNAGRRAEAAPEVVMPERGIESTLPGWVSRREGARAGADSTASTMGSRTTMTMSSTAPMKKTPGTP